MYRLTIIFLFVFCNASIAKDLKAKLRVNARAMKYSIAQTQEHIFEIQLKKDVYYHILIEQQGVSVIVYLKDKNNKTLQEKDSPAGKKRGQEKITFSPDSSDLYIITVKPLDTKDNSEGDYTISISEIPKKLQTFTLSQLTEDFEIVKNAYTETRVGLWYNSYPEFDSICRQQKNKLQNKMTALDFYRIVAPITSFTKEGHCYIKPSVETSEYLMQYGSYFPLFVKILNKEIYAVNDFESYKTSGLLISKINGIAADSILDEFTRIEPSDGFNFTSKYHWIETSFSKYYSRFLGSSRSFSIELINPVTKEKILYDNVPAVTYKEYTRSYQAFLKEHPGFSFGKPYLFSLDVLKNEALLTVNDFDEDEKDFQQFLDSCFNSIKENNIHNLIIDIRKNEGGAQGMEDILMSYLIKSRYEKYKYVAIPSTTYSFLEFTNYKNKGERLARALSKEFYQSYDGSLINKKGYYEGRDPAKIHFDGNIYILINGLTFSGASEFAALAKNHTNAVFIGEETGGGYYGNTSGNYLTFTLPQTKLVGRIPLCKFVVEVENKSVPFGRGVPADYTVQPTIQDILNVKDIELEFARTLINKK